MVKLTRAQERDERRKLGRGMTISVIALFLCWVPVLGLIMAAIGFIGVMRCITVKYKKRFVCYLLMTLLILMTCTGVLVGEVYAYSRDPHIIENAGTWLLETITGEPVYGGYLEDDYSSDYGFGMGMNEDLFSEGYYDADGNFISFGNETFEGEAYEDEASEDGAELTEAAG